MADFGQIPADTGEKVNYTKEAFNSQYNWIALVSTAAFSVLSGTALPILLAAGLELMYLSTIPRNRRFQRLVRSRKYAAAKRRTQTDLYDLAAKLPQDMRARYAGLQAVCTGIRSNYAQLSSSSQVFARQMEDRLDGLLQGFLRLLVAAQLHRDYLKTASPAEIEHEIAQLQKSIAGDPPKVQEINRRRIEILAKRLERFEKIGENSQVIEAQCSAMEDVLRLIRDQSVTMKDPQQVSDQLGSLVHDVEQTEDTIRQVEAIFDLTSSEIGVAPSFGTGSSTPLRSPPDTRTRDQS